MYEYHPLANHYPMAMPSEFELLKQSIKDRGQETAIVVYEGKILDGRNRYKACMELEIEPQIEEFIGSYEEAYDYSIQLNSGRRNLDKSQRAMVAAYNIERSRCEGTHKFTIKQAAQTYNVSERYIKRALVILDKNLSIAEQVFEGYETIGRAEQRIEEIEGKYNDIQLIEFDVSGHSQEDNELSDTYSYLYSLEKKSLVDIIIQNQFIKKGH